MKRSAGSNSGFALISLLGPASQTNLSLIAPLLLIWIMMRYIDRLNPPHFAAIDHHYREQRVAQKPVIREAAKMATSHTIQSENPWFI